MAPSFSYSVEDYPVSSVANQRVIGPIDESELPPPGSEVFVSRIPLYVSELELFPFFQQVGNIFKIRLMLGKMSRNRGFCYVTYTSPSEAEHAVKVLKDITFLGKYLTIEMSHDNCRLFVGGILEHKSKDEVWKELTNCGFEGIVEIIMYRSYTSRAKNRGYVFVDFESHQKAAQARYLFRSIKLWGLKLTVDWSTPLPRVDETTLNKVRILFFRNLKVTEPRDAFIRMLAAVLGPIPLQKVYRFKDYAFVHFFTRPQAEQAIRKLRDYFKNTFVEVTWAIPQSLAPKKRHMQTVIPKQNHARLSDDKQLAMSSPQVIQPSQVNSLQYSRMLFPRISSPSTNLESYEQFNNFLATSTPPEESISASISKDSAISLSNEVFW